MPSKLTRRNLIKLLTITGSIAWMRPALAFAAQQAKDTDHQDRASLWHRVSEHPWHPGFHLAPPYGWMNDPHTFFFNGTYHVFYQYSRIMDRPYGGGHSWGHAASRDLIHWTHYPPAMTPAEHGNDPEQHIFSGCLVDNAGVATALYSIDNIDVWTATSSDPDLVRFAKSPGNPLIEGPPGPGWAHEMRDPWVWREGQRWYLILGSSLDGVAAVPLYTSTDFKTWTYLHPLFVGDADLDKEFVECPFFFELGDRHVLAFASENRFRIGRFDQQRFHPESMGQLDYGRVYAAQVLRDDKGRTLHFGWIYETPPHGNGTLPIQKEWRTWFSLPDDQIGSGFAGAHTLPRVLMLVDGSLHIEPAEELERLREDHRQRLAIDLKDGQRIPLATGGAQFEIRARMDKFGSGSAGICIRCADIELCIGYDADQQRAFVRSSAASLVAPLALGDRDTLDLRVYFDHSIVEVFVDHRICITERIYPQDPKSATAVLFSEAADVHVQAVDGWILRPLEAELSI